MTLKIFRLIQLHDEHYDFSNTMPLVLQPTTDLTNREITPVENPDMVAMPWPKFSIEMDGDDQNLSWSNISMPTAKDLYIACVHCTEIAPLKYHFILYIRVTAMLDNRPPAEHTITITKADDPEAYEGAIALICKYLDLFYSNATGLVKTKDRQKYNSPSTHRRIEYRPKKFIYINNKPASSKKFNPNATTSTGQRIRWLSGWVVRSHWRVIKPESLGKDRYGKRSIKGKTWVNGHRKGEITEIIPRKKLLHAVKEPANRLD